MKWIKKGLVENILSNNLVVVYKYKGNGYFPEVVEKLQNKIGKFVYISYDDRLVHISQAQYNDFENLVMEGC